MMFRSCWAFPESGSCKSSVTLLGCVVLCALGECSGLFSAGSHICLLFIVFFFSFFLVFDHV